MLREAEDGEESGRRRRVGRGRQKDREEEEKDGKETRFGRKEHKE